MLLSALAGYQYAYIERLSRPSTPASESRPDDAVYMQLRSTCQNWRRWYREDGRELSRINRDRACRRSDEYAKSVLNIQLPSGGTKLSDDKNAEAGMVLREPVARAVLISSGQPDEQLDGDVDVSEALKALEKLHTEK